MPPMPSAATGSRSDRPGQRHPTVYGAIRDANPDERVIAIQYLDTMTPTARPSKLFIPYEATAIPVRCAGQHPGSSPASPATAAATAAMVRLVRKNPRHDDAAGEVVG